MPVMDADMDMASPPIFRPLKRRKFLRRRVDYDELDGVQSSTHDAEEDAGGAHQATPTPLGQETEDSAPSTRFAKLRKPFRARRGGIEFSATSRFTPDAAARSTNPEPTSEDMEAIRIQAMCDRFTPHTEQKVDVDKHMYGPQLDS